VKFSGSIFFIITFLVFLSCKTSYEPANPKLPYGIWIYFESDDNVQIYYSAKEFEKDKSGFEIKKNNIFIERTSGWCGTPPVSFYNVEGRWELYNQNILKITTKSWISDDYIRLMEIVSETNEELEVIFHLQHN